MRNKTAALVLFLLSMTRLVCAQSGSTSVPSTMFSMHFNHSRGNSSQESEVSYGAFRLWDTATGWAGDKWTGIATCDPKPPNPCNPELQWNWQSLDGWLSDMHNRGVVDVLYTIGGVPAYANGCTSGDPTNCSINSMTNPNELPNNNYSCGNTWKAGCVLPPDLPKDGGALGDTNDGFFQRFVTALANHVYGVTTSSFCNGMGYLACHAKIVQWDAMNEWDRNALLHSSGYQTNMTIYATYAQMQRMTADLSSIVKSYGVGAEITTPSTGGPNESVDKNFLYCNDGYTSSCNNLLLGNGNPSSIIDVFITHHYFRVDDLSQDPENLLGANGDYSKMLSWLATNERNAWQNSIWLTESSWGCDQLDNGPPGDNDTCSDALADYDLQAAFTARLFLDAWASGLRRVYWYSADNCGYPNAENEPFGTGTLFGPKYGTGDCSSPPSIYGLWWSGKAENQIYNWMVGNIMTQLCDTTVANNNIYTCVFTAASGGNTLAVWDTAETCGGSPDPHTHGICGIHPWAYPSGYRSYDTLDPADGTKCLSGGTVGIGAKPILLNNKPCTP